MAPDPLAYLEQALRARQGLGRRQAPFLYRRWRKASIAGLAISDARTRSARPECGTVYFTSKTDGKALLMVVPDLGLAFYLWNDHIAPRFDSLMRSLVEGEGGFSTSMSG
jgi:hypothetical protein